MPVSAISSQYFSSWETATPGKGIWVGNKEYLLPSTSCTAQGHFDFTLSLFQPDTDSRILVGHNIWGNLQAEGEWDEL